MKPIDRLMYIQGGECFFCKRLLPAGEASIEHLHASANGGTDAEENRVACCKTLNALLGSKSLKQKIQVILNQKGAFKCPATVASPKKAIAVPVRPAVAPSSSVKTPVQPAAVQDRLVTVVNNLKQRESGRPRTRKTLSSTINSLFTPKMTDSEIAALVGELENTGKISTEGEKINYSL